MTNSTKHNMLRTTALLTYAASVPLANWMIDNVGNAPAFPGGPHTIPVGFGFSAPSGVLAIGVALAARDAVQRMAGKKVALAAIAVGVMLSFLFASPALAAASAAAFLLSELADFGVYTPLRKRHLALAVMVSGVVGGVIDSLIFLQIAFGSTMFWQGQVLGKAWVAVAGAAVVVAVRKVRRR
jgi:queuosine precursor transporter